MGGSPAFRRGALVEGYGVKGGQSVTGWPSWMPLIVVVWAISWGGSGRRC